MRRRALLVALALVVGLLVTACASGRGGSKVAENSGAMDSGAPSPAPAPSGAKPPEMPAQPGGQPSANVPVSTDRKLILNAQLDLKVKDADEAVSAISTAVRNAGGFIQDSKRQGTKQQGRTVSMVLRVPAGQYGSVVDLLSGLGEVQSRRDYTEDVTEHYVDIEARIKTMEEHVAQLQKLYARTGTVKEMMELEQEIARVTAELESLKGRFRVLSNQVELSTITINLFEPNAPAPIQPPKTTWERMQQGFLSSWNGVINFTSAMIVFAAAALPVLAYLAILGGVGYGIYRLVRRTNLFRRPPSA